MSEFPFIIGEHPSIRKIQALIKKVAPSDATVLVTGESGTGKELAARATHELSARIDRPFIPMNCSAIPAELLESEIFGHERGAFTGAIGARAGMFQLANGGTIFLDEIGEMSPRLQGKLLRVLQDREIRPVGSDRTLKVDVRVIAATNRDLQREVARGTFREDLFYRLQVVPITMPPLRERMSDVPLLTTYFLDKHNRRRPDHRVVITEDAMKRLDYYDWPGNVRELENLIERLVILSDSDIVEVDNLPEPVRSAWERKRAASHLSTAWSPAVGTRGSLQHEVDRVEREIIINCLRQSGSIAEAARSLGLSRAGLYKKLKKHGLRRVGQKSVLVVDANGFLWESIDFDAKNYEGP